MQQRCTEIQEFVLHWKDELSQRMAGLNQNYLDLETELAGAQEEQATNFQLCATRITESNSSTNQRMAQFEGSLDQVQALCGAQSAKILAPEVVRQIAQEEIVKYLPAAGKLQNIEGEIGKLTSRMSENDGCRYP